MVRKVLVIIARDGFQDHELAGVRRGLQLAGFQIVLASTRSGPCTGKFGSVEQAQIALPDVAVEEFDRTVFIGGPGAGSLVENEEAKAIARSTVAAGKVLGAICIAPLILAHAGVLKGKRATVWDSGTSVTTDRASGGEQAAILKEYGAIYTGEKVTIDGKIVTGNGPMAAEEFGRAVATLN